MGWENMNMILTRPGEVEEEKAGCYNTSVVDWIQISMGREIEEARLERISAAH